jgi:hypothetical protein
VFDAGAPFKEKMFAVTTAQIEREHDSPGVVTCDMLICSHLSFVDEADLNVCCCQSLYPSVSSSWC